MTETQWLGAAVALEHDGRVALCWVRRFRSRTIWPAEALAVAEAGHADIDLFRRTTPTDLCCVGIAHRLRRAQTADATIKPMKNRPDNVPLMSTASTPTSRAIIATPSTSRSVRHLLYCIKIWRFVDISPLQ